MRKLILISVVVLFVITGCASNFLNHCKHGTAICTMCEGTGKAKGKTCYYCKGTGETCAYE